MAFISNIEDISINKYYCGSQRLCHEIRTKLNIVPVKVYKNKNKKIINVFIMTKELSEFLTEWSNNNPNKK